MELTGAASAADNTKDAKNTDVAVAAAAAAAAAGMAAASSDVGIRSAAVASAGVRSSLLLPLLPLPVATACAHDHTLRTAQGEAHPVNVLTVAIAAPSSPLAAEPTAVGAVAVVNCRWVRRSSAASADHSLKDAVAMVALAVVATDSESDSATAAPRAQAATMG